MFEFVPTHETAKIRHQKDSIQLSRTRISANEVQNNNNMDVDDTKETATGVNVQLVSEVEPNRFYWN